MGNFDFGQVGGKRFANQSWVDDPDAWTGTAIAPMEDIPFTSPPQTTWDKVKAFDFSGLASDINPRQMITQLGQGIVNGLNNSGTIKQANSFDKILASSSDQGASEYGNQQLQNYEKQQDYIRANPVNSIPAMIGEQIPQIPLWMAGQGAVSALGKGIGKLAPSILPMAEKVGSKLPSFAKGGLMDAATYGTVVAPVDSIRNNDNLSQFLDREKQLPGVFLGGAGLRGAGDLVGKGISGVRSALKPIGVPNAPLPQSIAPTPIVRHGEPIQSPSVAPVAEAPVMGGPLNRFEVRPEQRVQGTEIPRSNAIQEPIAIPQQTITTPQQPNIGEPRIVNERGFAGNVRDSQVAPEGIKQNTLDNPLAYEPITNRETLNKANTIVETDAVKARELFDAPSKGISAYDVALGESLIVKAIKDGDSIGANKLIADLAEKLTTAGQAVQAASIFKRLTPEGMLLYAQRVVNSANKDLLNRLGLNAPKVELTAADSKFITDTMTRVQKLGDGDEKNVAMAQVMKLISEKVPATLTDKIKALQRISLLLNPKTMTRNILGNTVFGAIDNASNVVATPIDMLTSKLLKTPRTTTLPSIPGQLKSMAEGVKLTARDAKLGIDTYHTKTQYEFSGKRNFNNAALNKLDRATIVGLKVGDTPFHKAAYDDVLRQQLKLAKTDKPTQAMKDQAQSIADQRTYQDVNDMTEAFKMVQKALNKVSSAVGLGNAEFGLGNFVTPFVKTPANILKRAIEYSPVGITTAIKEATKKGKGTFDQKAFVDSISRSVTGTALIMAGYDLAKRGIITGSGNKDKDVAAFERGLGKNDYAYKYGDQLYTYDWMQPGSMALAIGADVYIKGKDRKQAENVVIDAVKSGGETLFKQSLLQGVTRFMSGYSPMDNVATTAINAPTQFIPTISKQISQLKDPLQRTTYAPTKLETGGNLLKARIPGITESLEPKINTSGEKVQTFQGNNSVANIFFNPGSKTTFKPNDVQKEILRIYETTGDKTIFPRVAPKSLTIKGETFKLTPKEMTSFQQSLGKNTEARMRDIINYKDPRTFSQQERDDRKVKELAKAIEKAYEDSKEAFVLNRK